MKRSTLSESSVIKSLSSSLLLAIIALLGIGVVQVYSSSYVLATENYGDGLFFFKRQLTFAFAGFAILMLTIHTPWRWIEKYAWVCWAFSAIGVALTFIPGLGVRVGGAYRWLYLPGGYRFEPAEILKVSFVLFVASLFCRKENILSRIPKFVLFFALAIPLFLLLKQPDFGTFTIIILVGLGLLFAFGLPWKYIISALVVSVPAFYFLVMTVPYRRARVMTFLDPWSDPANKGFQVIQSMLSFHSGGITGVGLGQGQGKLFFLPEAHTDFTMAVFGEELGFIGFCTLLILYGFVVFKTFQISFKAKDTFRKCLALGFALIFSFSVFINMGVALGLVPTKGLTLPFLSYGGSSLLCLCFLFGLVINIENSIDSDTLKPVRRGKVFGS